MDKKPERALLVSGDRQVGKTFSTRNTLKRMGIEYIELNLIFNPGLIEILDKSYSAHDLMVNLSLATGKKLIPGRTYIFIDEVQQYSEILTINQILGGRRKF